MYCNKLKIQFKFYQETVEFYSTVLLLVTTHGPSEKGDKNATSKSSRGRPWLDVSKKKSTLTIVLSIKRNKITKCEKFAFFIQKMFRDILNV